MADVSQPNRVVLHIDADTTGAEQKIARVEQILNNAELSEKSKVMSIAALYKKQGVETAAAMQKAWQQVRGSAQSAAVPVQQQTTFFERLRTKVADVTARVKQFGTAALQSGKTAGRGFSLLNATAASLSATFASLFAVTRVLTWAKTCVSASSDTENALRGLNSILNGQGRGFSDAQGFIEDYIADGLVPLQNAVTAYKNLAARGYNDTQIRSVLTALKDSAAYGRQASYTLGDAVMSATEGLKNENSVLVDNAGVTKNVARMWDDYARSVGTTANQLTQQQRIQAEVNGILAETRFQTGDAARIAGTFSGQVSQLRANIRAFNAAVGDLLKAGLLPFIGWLNRAAVAATTFLRTIGEALGITSGSSGFEGMSASAAQAADSTDTLTDSINTAKKAQDRLLAASFDEFNVIGTPQEETDGTEEVTGTASAYAPAADLSGYTEGIAQTSDGMDELREKARAFAETWLSGWEIIKQKWTEFKENWQSGWEIIKQKWTEFKENWQSGWEIIKQKWTEFKENWQSGWEIIKQKWTEFKENWQSGWEIIKQKWTEFKENWQSGWEIIKQKWTEFKENWQSGWEIIKQKWTEFKENWQSGWEIIKQKWTEFKENWQSGWEIIKQKWTEFKENWQSGVQVVKDKCAELKEKWNSFRDAWKSGIQVIREKWEGFKNNWASGVQIIKEKFGEVKEKWNDFKSNWNSGVDSIKSRLSEFKENWKSGFDEIRDKAAEKWDSIADKIKAPFQTIGDWFHDTFHDAWQRVKDVFSGSGDGITAITDGISGTFKTTVNGLIDGINSALRIPFWNLSEALRVIREWEFAGYYPFQWLPSVEIPELPRLAKGGIVSQPTLAMVGDNPNAKSDPEIVSPLSKLRAMLPAQGADDAQTLAKLDQLIILLELLLAAVRDMDTNGQTMSDKDIYAAAQRGKRRVQRMKGMT